MIESLKYVVTFNTTGRTLKNQLNFKPGITAIKGENEAGKSFVLEMIRFALFGSDALRGLKTDYEKLDVTLKIWIKGRLHTIRRLNNKAWANGNEAVGTTAVNAFVIKQLGFGLSVFDIACNAKQGQLDRLTEDMKPAERKRMIDEVTGLHQYERVEKECREEANTYRKVAEAMENQIVEPIKPHKPDDYEPSGDLQLRLDAEIRNQAFRDSLVIVQKPEKPQEPSGSRDAIEHEKEREADNRQRSMLKAALNKLPVINEDYTKEQLEEFKMWYVQEARGPRPKGYDSEQLKQWEHDHVIRQTNGEPTRCPNCGTIVEGQELPPEPPLSVVEIYAEHEAQRAWEGVNDVLDIPEPPIGQSDVNSRLSAYDSVRDRGLLDAQLRELGDEMLDRSTEASEWLAYDRDTERYAVQQHEYGNYLQRKLALERLPDPEPFLREKLDMAKRYENLLSNYEALLDVYDTQLGKIKEAKEKQDGFKRGAEALKDIRKEVKRYLVPSLSKVASHLLQEMTDGERRSIKIDEEFEIYVDNQHVRTLSGSGVSVVNLALRIALGKVLTQSVIPFFMADEIDANMAERRTKATHKALKRLKLKQILVVTHKDFEGDQTICLT